MHEDRFKIGDVVVLKSGSPQMTVISSPQKYAYNIIFFYNGKLEQCLAVPEEALRLYKEPPLELDQ